MSCTYLHLYGVLFLTGMDEWAESKFGFWWDYGLNLKGKWFMCWVKSIASGCSILSITTFFCVLLLNLARYGALTTQKCKMFCELKNSMLHLPGRYSIFLFLIYFFFCIVFSFSWGFPSSHILPMWLCCCPSSEDSNFREIIESKKVLSFHSFQLCSAISPVLLKIMTFMEVY